MGRVAVAACLLLVGGCFVQTLAPSFPIDATVGNRADRWARAVADAIADSHFYRRFTKAEAPARFQALVPKAEFDGKYGVLSGRNPALGVLRMHANVVASDDYSRWWVQEAMFVLPERDAEGHEVYPVLKALLQERLRSPVWNLVSDGMRQYWRKGKTRYIVSLDLTAFSAADFEGSGPGRYVMAGAGQEQGESEGRWGGAFVIELNSPVC